MRSLLRVLPGFPVYFAALLSFCFVPLGGIAQDKPVQAAGGTVSGHVVYGDTMRPARFMKVYLKPVKRANLDDDLVTALLDSAISNMQAKGGGDDAAELKQARFAARNLMQNVNDALLTVCVDADGVYTFTGVPAGAYFVHVKAPGYIDPLLQFSADELESRDPAVQKKVLAANTLVTVGGSETVRADMRLELGAAITGLIRYDDGGPAVGWTVRAIARHAATEQASDLMGIDLSGVEFGQKTERVLTDDSGRFRIAGLPSGEYVLEAHLTAPALDQSPFSAVSSSQGSFLSILGGLSHASSLRLTVYSGSATRLSAATSISVHAGEQRGGGDMTVALHDSRTVTGFVTARGDGHPVNDGTVELVAQDAEGKDDASVRLSAAIHEDGSFRFDYVPGPGAFTLRSVHARDASQVSTMKLMGALIAERKTRRLYGRGSTTVTVGDADVNNVKVVVSDGEDVASR